MVKHPPGNCTETSGNSAGAALVWPHPLREQHFPPQSLQGASRRNAKYACLLC